MSTTDPGTYHYSEGVEAVREGAVSGYTFRVWQHDAMLGTVTPSRCTTRKQFYVGTTTDGRTTAEAASVRAAAMLLAEMAS